MKRRILIGTFAVIVAALLCGISLRSFGAANDEDDTGYSQIAIFAKALQLIRQDYVDGNKTSYHDLVTAALKGMLSSLDPHSQFMDPDDFRDMQEDTRSRFNGLGIEVAIKNGLPTVVTPMEDTPAAKAGILSGDQILKINVQSVKGARLLDPDLTGAFKIAYVRLIQFNEPTAEELSKTLGDLQKQGMQALVLDLRNNPGGLLNSAVDVCAQFLPPNTKVVSTQGRVASQQREYSTSGVAKERPNYPMAVLVNEGSASGAEIVSGALKDLHRAIVVGETTFGKGSVQNVMQLPDGSALRFTTAKYYTPSKVVIQGNGVVPNILVPLTADQDRAVSNLRNDPKITPAEATNLIKTKDLQLMRGIDALKGVMIYAQQNAPKANTVKK